MKTLCSPRKNEKNTDQMREPEISNKSTYDFKARTLDN